MSRDGFPNAVLRDIPKRGPQWSVGLTKDSLSTFNQVTALWTFGAPRLSSPPFSLRFHVRVSTRRSVWLSLWGVLERESAVGCVQNKTHIKLWSAWRLEHGDGSPRVAILETCVISTL